MIPLIYVKNNQLELARYCFLLASQVDPRNAHTWQAWALMEKEAGNVGDFGKEYSARWLFKRGTDADPRDAHTWQAWAVMERDLGNIKVAAELIVTGLEYCANSQDLIAIQNTLQHIHQNDIQKLHRLISNGEASKAKDLLKELLFNKPDDEEIAKLHKKWQEEFGNIETI